MIKISFTGDVLMLVHDQITAYCKGVIGPPAVSVTSSLAPATVHIDGAQIAVGEKPVVVPAVTPVVPAAVTPVIAVVDPVAVADALAAGANVQLSPVSGLPWDGRINTANKACKENGDWKRKPAVPKAEYDAIVAELEAAVAAAPAVGPATPDVNAVATAQAADPIAVAGTAAALPVAAAGPTLNDIQERSVAMSTALGILGPRAIAKVLTQFGAVVPSPDGLTPAAPLVSALTLENYPRYLHVCDAVIANAASITDENLESMIEAFVLQ